jgi:hypothetical protein
MGVSVDSKHRDRVETRGGVSVFGGGLLERARSTTLALLGVTAALGLAMVALALNQSWPLVAGSAIPVPPQAGLGKATAVAAAPSGASGPVASGAAGSARDGRAVASQSDSEAPAPGSPAESSEFVVSPSTPVADHTGGAPAPSAPRGAPQPTPQQSEPVAEAPATQAPPTPAPVQVAPPPPVASEATPPPPQAAEAPGQGEAEEAPSESEGDEEEDEDGGSHGHGGGHHWGWGR